MPASTRPRTASRTVCRPAPCRAPRSCSVGSRAPTATRPVSMEKQLHEAIRAVRFDVEARVLIITGAGHTFCAGDDVAEFPVLTTRQLAYDSATPLAEPTSDPRANGFLIVSMFQETAAMLEGLTDIVTVAAVDGVCLAAGLELPLGCDF